MIDIPCKCGCSKKEHGNTIHDNLDKIFGYPQLLRCDNCVLISDDINAPICKCYTTDNLSYVETLAKEQNLI